MHISCLSICLLSGLLLLPPDDWRTPFERSDKLASATPAEAVAYYQRLSDHYPELRVLEAGPSDVGKPIHLVVISQSQEFDPVRLRAQGKRILLINNGIHPGEPCGIDACLMLARNLLQQAELRPLLRHTVICIVPVYNLGGALNRGCCSRANQVGPLAYGFRGNARNYDLNRDFLKCDTRNAHTFSRVFHEWWPDVFVDTHTTNGADYQAALTYIPTHPDKLQPGVARYMQEKMIPAIAEHMDQEQIIMCPYVNVFGTSPDRGITGFLDLPRYSSGYTGLFQTMGFITEAHMLKPFAERVAATYAFLHGLLRHLDQAHAEIGAVVAEARAACARQQRFALDWKLDISQADSLHFAGYVARYKTSQVTGKQRLYYDRSMPYTKVIPFRNHYVPAIEIEAPQAYLIPQAYQEVIERLRLNQVDLQRLSRDTSLEAEVYYIENVVSSLSPYEGHFYHRDLELRSETQLLRFYEGDYVAWVNQEQNAYLVHALEPQARDAFFRWNFFDGILMQKEYFSPYVFEDEAAEMLAADPALKAAFEAQKARDSSFAENAMAQLRYLYERSTHFEPSYRRYPIARWQGGNLPLRSGH